MSKKGRNIYKRKDGRWEGRYVKRRINGKIKYGYIYAKTYREAKEKLETLPKEPDIAKSHSKSVPVFYNIAWEWLELQKAQLKNSSIIKYRNILTAHLLPYFGEYPIETITREYVTEVCNELLLGGGSNGKSLSPKTVTGIISVLKNVLDYGSQGGKYKTADLNRITFKQTQNPMRILTINEQQTLSSYLCSNPSPTNLGILLSLYTGMRIGEICALKWEDISFEEQYVSVDKTMQRLQTPDDKKAKTSVTVSNPKSSCSIRKIPLPNEIFQYLTIARCPGNSYFLTGHPRFYVEPRTLQNRFKVVMKECGIEEINFHVLRHTFATRCVELNFDVKSLSEILGHASVNITLNRYVHPSMQLKQKNMNMLSDLMTVK